MPPKRALGDITNALRPSANSNNHGSKSLLNQQPGKPAAAATKLRRTAVANGPANGVARRTKPAAQVPNRKHSPMSTTAPRRTSARLAERAAIAAAATASVFPAPTTVDSAAPSSTVVVNSSAPADDVSFAPLPHDLSNVAVYDESAAAHPGSSLEEDDDLQLAGADLAMHDGGDVGPQLPIGAIDIDAADHNNCLTASQYATMIHSLFKRREIMFMPDRHYMDRQQDVTIKMRSILVDWLVDVHLKFRLRPETLYLTVNIIDRFLASTIVNRRKLQLVGVTAMFIASKYEEIYAPEVNDFVYISDKAYTRGEVLSMEATVLNVLRFEVTMPYSLTFLRRALKAVTASLGASHESHTHLAHYLIELALPDSHMLAFPPSLIAAAAVNMAGKMTRANFFWDDNIAFHAGGYAEADLAICESHLARLLEHEVDPSGSNKLTAVKRKFNAQRHGSIASAIFFHDGELAVLGSQNAAAFVPPIVLQGSESSGEDEVFVDANGGDTQPQAAHSVAGAASGASHMDICEPAE